MSQLNKDFLVLKPNQYIEMGIINFNKDEG